jgi:hypothetical protein
VAVVVACWFGEHRLRNVCLFVWRVRLTVAWKDTSGPCREGPQDDLVPAAAPDADWKERLVHQQRSQELDSLAPMRPQKTVEGCLNRNNRVVKPDSRCGMALGYQRQVAAAGGDTGSNL